MSTATITEADVLSEVVAPDQADLSPDLARSLLELRFTDRAEGRTRELLRKNNDGEIAEAERAELHKYLRVGQFLDLLQVKARLSLEHRGAPTAAADRGGPLSARIDHPSG